MPRVALENDGHIFHILEDKLRAYMFTTRVLHAKAPLVLHCEDSYFMLFLVVVSYQHLVLLALSGISNMTAADVFVRLGAVGNLPRSFAEITSLKSTNT